VAVGGVEVPIESVEVAVVSGVVVVAIGIIGGVVVAVFIKGMTGGVVVAFEMDGVEVAVGVVDVATEAGVTGAITVTRWRLNHSATAETPSGHEL